MKKPHFSPNFGTFPTFSQEPDFSLKIRLRQFLRITHIFHLKKESRKNYGANTENFVLRTYVHTYQTKFLGPPAARGSKNLIQN